MVRVKLRCDGLTMLELRALETLLRAENGVEDAQVTPPTGYPMNRMVKAAITPMEIRLILKGVFACSAGAFVLQKFAGKSIENAGEAFFDELGTAEWARAVARYLKTLPHRPEPYMPTISIMSVDEGPSKQASELPIEDVNA